MGTNRTLIVQIIILIIIIRSFPTGAFKDRLLNGLAEQVGNDDKKTLVVLVDTLNKHNDPDDDQINRNEEEEALNDIDNALIKDNYQNLLYSLLRNTNDPENYEGRKIEEYLIEEALRARCQKKVSCEKKCQTKPKPKKERNCKKRCKTTYDDLLNCQEKQKNKSKKRMTQPPSWH